MSMYRDGGAYFVFGGKEGGGGGLKQEAPETLTCRGFWGNSPPENLEIVKLRKCYFQHS